MTYDQPDQFTKPHLSPAVTDFLREINPWWDGRPGRVLPTYRRWAFSTIQKKLESQLAPVTVIRGPRQVGKTTLQEQLIAHLLSKYGIAPHRILRVQFDEIPSLQNLDEPILAIARWFQKQILRRTFNEAAHSGEPALLFLDEVQNLKDWAPQLKALVDHHSVHVMVTGSSSLRIEAGKDSLAGRISTLTLGTLLLREIAGIRDKEEISAVLPENGLEPLLSIDFWRTLNAHGAKHKQVRDRAFKAFSERGGYPVAQANQETLWPEIADQLNESVIHRVIQHDLRMGDRGRKRDPQLLEEVFRLVCRYAGQAPSPAMYTNELNRVLQSNMGWQRVQNYLRFLDGALLVRLIPPLELRLKKVKGNQKLCVVDHGLRASWLEEVVPLEPDDLARLPHLTDLAGHLAESVVGSFLSQVPHLDLAHFPERPTEPEVDFILTIGEHRIPLEIKYRRHIDTHRDTLGLRSFLNEVHYNAPFGVLVTMLPVIVPDPRIVTIPLPSLLLMR